MLCHLGSSLKAVNNLSFKAIISAYTSNLEITSICRIPGHSGIAGNEVADKMAAGAVLQDTVDITTVPYTDIKPHIKHLCKRWHIHWSEQTDRQTTDNKQTDNKE